MSQNSSISQNNQMINQINYEQEPERGGYQQHAHQTQPNMSFQRSGQIHISFGSSISASPEPVFKQSFQGGNINYSNTNQFQSQGIKMQSPPVMTNINQLQSNRYPQPPSNINPPQGKPLIHFNSGPGVPVHQNYQSR